MEYPRNLVRADVKIYFSSDKPVASYKDVFIVRHDYGGFSICNARTIIEVIKKYSEGHPSDSILLSKIERLMSDITVCDDDEKTSKMRNALQDCFKHYSHGFACEFSKIR